MTEVEVDPRVERTRERVHFAVVELLHADGLDAITHTRVADASGVGRATLYRHWPDVGSLLIDAVVNQHRRSTRDVVTDLPDDVDLRTAALRIIGLIGSMLREDPMVPVMLGMLERAEHDPVYTDIRNRIQAMQAEPVDRLLQREVERGNVPVDLDLDHAKAQLVGPFFFARLMLGRPLGEHHVEPHVDGWLRAIGWTG